MGRNLNEPPPNPGVPSKPERGTNEWGAFGDFLGKLFAVVMAVLALAVIVSFGIKLILVMW